MRVLWIVLGLFAVAPAQSGELVRFSCGTCYQSSSLMLGRGFRADRYYVPALCRRGSLHVVSVAAGSKTREGCSGKLTPFTFVEGMACPMCPGTKMERQRVGFWD